MKFVSNFSFICHMLGKIKYNKKFKFYYNSFIKVLGVLGAYSHLVSIWLFFLRIFVKKYFVKLSSNENAQLIVLYAVYIMTNIM